MEPAEINGTYYTDEKAAEIAENFSYEGYQIVRREMFAHQRVPSVTIRKDSITFNTACINGLEDAIYVQLMMSRNQRRMLVLKCDESTKEAIRWCIAKPDKRKTRKITGPNFSGMIYQMMGWDDTCRYKITGHRIEYRGETLYVFELEEPEIFRERPKRTKEEREEMERTMAPEQIEELRKKEIAESRKAFYPHDVENTFGVPVEQHEDKIDIGSPTEYTGMSEFSAGGNADGR